MSSQGVAQHPLGLTVRRGAVEEGLASVEGNAHNLLARLLLLAAAHVENLPGPKTHGRDPYVAAPEPAALRRCTSVTLPFRRREGLLGAVL